jgi:hypothetical protein
MDRIARLSFKDGGLILPAYSPYERELLVECVEATSKRYGRLVLEVNGRHWTISVSSGLRRVCVSCSQWPDDLTYPGGSSGTFSVVSSRALPCSEAACELAQVGAHAAVAPDRTVAGPYTHSEAQLGE